MIRTAVQGDITMDKICTELVAQHSRVHEQEIRRKGGGFKGGFKGYGHHSKGFGRGKSWSRSYHVEDDSWSDDWDSQSQSLGGCDDVESYHAEELYVNDEDEALHSVYVSLLEEGLDETNDEAAEYAADVMQVEAEAFFVKNRAHGSGHYGFGGSRQFQVQGHLTLEERRARVQALKSRTTCRRCGQQGHWSNDPQCPKGFKKGKGKYGGGSTPANSSASAGSSTKGKSNYGGKSGKSEKKQTVFFTINEYQDVSSLPTNSQAYMMESETADERLDRLIAEAHVQSLQTAAQVPLADDDQDWEVEVCLADVEGAEDVELTNAMEVLRNPQRQLLLDQYLSHAPRSEEWDEVYHERWNEFDPGHLMFTDSDRAKILHWADRARRGLPKLPTIAITDGTTAVPAVHGAEITSSSFTTPLTSSMAACEHRNLTRQGSNGHKRVLKCRDCGLVLESEKVEKTSPMQISKDECDHKLKSWTGSNSSIWQWRCKTCGHMEKGNRASDPRLSSSSRDFGQDHGDKSEDVMVRQIMEIFNTTVDLQKEVGTSLTVELLNKIYGKCRDFVVKQHRETVASRPQTPSMPSTSGLHEMKKQCLGSGIHRGKTFEQVFLHEKNYVKALIGKFRGGSLKDANLIQFVEFCLACDGMNKAFMVSTEIEDEQISEELYVILDTGCNNTCHGSRWMERFIQLNGVEPELQQSEGRFKGVGGRVDVAGKRDIPMTMKTLDDEYVPGSITSIELADSDAPLLLSSKVQIALGLVLDMSEYTAYSKALDKELELVDLNGLPALRLYPGEAGLPHIAMHVDQEHNGVSDMYQEDNGHMSEQEVLEHEAGSDYVLTEEDAAANENCVPLAEHKVKIMSKGQKKVICDSMEDIQKEDSAMWSVLQDKVRRPKRMLPRGCKVFLMEVFAGAATLSCMAASLGLPIAAPVDIEYDARYDLTNKSNRDRLSREIEEEDPFLLTLAPLCGPWCKWQDINLQRGKETYDKIMMDRKTWYPVVEWVCKIVESRVSKGREVVVENPWPSMMWKLYCFDKMMEKGISNHLTGEPLELLRLDQCMYGLINPDNGIPHQKGTGMLLSSSYMKAQLSMLCDGSHPHSPLEGGSRTKKAQQWPTGLCESILKGATEELKNQILRFSFPAEFEAEDRDGMEQLDAIHGIPDLAEPPMKRPRIDLEELDKEEDYEQLDTPEVEDYIHEKERLRKQQWTKIPREKRVAIRRLHQMMGHCSTPALVRMLKSSLSSKDVIEAAKHFRCQSCDEVKKDEAPRVTKPIRPPSQLRFNDEISADVFEIKDSEGNRHSILNIIDMATHYQVLVRVGNGGTPSSKICAQALNASWLSWAGAPRIFTSDQGVHNKGMLASFLTSHGTEIRRTGARAAHQLGVAERHGGMAKEVLKKAIQNRQLHGAEAISALCSEAARAKNVLMNHSGFSPTQWVLGHTPDDLTSLIDQDPQQHLGVHQGLVDAEEKTPQENFMLQLLIRQAAKEAFVQVDSSQRIRKAMLRKSAPVRGPYRTGDLVCFSKQGKWFGPARVLTNEGKSSLWLIHRGVTVLISETSCRPASTQEIMKKHILELRPSRKRKRDLYMEEPDDEDLPFADDVEEAMPHQGRGQEQFPFVDLNDAEVPVLGPNGDASVPGVAANPGIVDEPYSPSLMADDPEAPTDVVDHPPGLEGPEVENVPSLPSLTSTSHESGLQPELEISPQITPVLPEAEFPASAISTPMVQPEVEPPATVLTQALRHSPDQFDGVPPRSNFATKDDDRCWAFVASRQIKKFNKKFKRVKKVGAGRELNFDREQPHVQQKLLETRRKEWANWQNYTDGYWIIRSDLEAMKQKDPSLKVIPTRWVDVDKSEDPDDPQLKSRLVVRGDLEDASQMRTDSPTCSMLMLSLVLAMSACRDSDLLSGDISAAFLQGSKLDRVLVLSMPRGGIPDQPEERFYVVSTTVYGTKDAPRGWFKKLNGTIIEKGFRAVPHEAAAYTLNDDHGNLQGLVVIHVDDLLWTGGPEIEAKMNEICEIYKFGKLSKNNFKYCGREIVKDAEGVHITCPALIDRVKPIYMTAEQRKMKTEKVPENIKLQLRSIIGSSAWLSRVCRPDLSYSVSYLQSNVSNATFEHVHFANNMVKIARNSKNVGIHFPIRAFRFEDCMIVGLQDASFANDAFENEKGVRSGLRSQSGRVLCLASKDFQRSHQGHLLMLDWHSTTIKRVCRSTLQAETMSLLSGLEECEHARFVLHGLWNHHDRRDQCWQIAAQDEFAVNLYTDCRSLHEHVIQPGMTTVSDKRLAIDLSSVRQLIWRQQGESLGDPLLTDRLPKDQSTALHWLNTEKMIADCLTKSMRPGSLVLAMKGALNDLTPENLKECENQD